MPLISGCFIGVQKAHGGRMAETPILIRTYKYRLLPNKRQHADLNHILEYQRQLYNAALESRISYYAKTGRSLSLFEQSRELTQLRKTPEFAFARHDICRATLKRLDLAYQAFFRRVKRGEKPGFPRFKSKARWTSFWSIRL
jgi:putative transposase